MYQRTDSAQVSGGAMRLYAEAEARLRSLAGGPPSGQAALLTCYFTKPIFVQATTSGGAL